MENIVDILTALGSLVAGIALILNIAQFKSLENSIRGNTYQQLTGIAIELKRILLEHPELEYLYTKKTDPEERNQIILLRLIGNYLDNAWYQKKYGLVDKELWGSYDELIKELLREHPEIKELILQKNFSKSFRDYINSITSS